MNERRLDPRIHTFLMTFCLFLCVSAPLLMAQGGGLTLEDCVRMALEAPSSVTVARLERDIADQDRVVARAGFLPQGTLNSGYNYNSPHINDPEMASFIPSDAIRVFSSLATVVQNVDAFGRIRAEYQRARANQDIAGANLAIAERDLRRAVAGAYYRLLLARKRVEVLEATVDEAADFENRTTLLMQSGEAARADVVKATAQTALFRRELLAAGLDAELANQALASFWTDDVTPRLALVDIFDQPIPQPPRLAPQAEAYLARPEFQLSEAQRRGFQADARRARASLLPDLQLAFQWGVDQSLPGLSFDDRGYAVSANLNLTLFDWFRTRGQIRQAEARAAQVLDRRAMLGRQLSAEYQSAWARVQDVYEQISLARIQMTAAEEDLRLSRVRYEGGAGTALDVVTAQRQLTDARSGYYTAIAEYLNARRDLEVASGQ